MTPYLYAVDEIFPPFEFDLLRAYAWRLEYKDQEGPDGVVYPGIGLPVPESSRERLTHTLSWLLGYKVVLKICAFRLSVEGTVPPQWAHSDAQVSRYAAFVYMNEGPGGTVLLQHIETDMRVHPRNQAELDVWQRDHSTVEAWQVCAAVDCAPNRAVIMPSELIHAAMPPRGFGSSAHDGRLILWSFFD
jgi:Family of unknown function (DUF6445)